MCPAGHTKIESRIVNEDYHIWLKLSNTELGKVKKRLDGPDVSGHFPETHESCFLDGFQLARRMFSHLRPAPESKARIRVLPDQFCHQHTPIEVA